MNNDMKLSLATNFHEAANVEIFRNALSLIANEIERFQYELREEKIERNEHFDILNNCAAKINMKNRKLKKLKEHLKIACNIAKIIISAKNRDMEHLTYHLNVIVKESSDLAKSKTQNLNLIQQLQMEKCNINNDMKLISNFIHLGYKKLQEMRNETPKEVPLIEELETILLACGQYYADYCNERDQCEQLQQRNTFLNSKLSILEKNLSAAAEELRNLKNHNMRLRIKWDLRHRNGEKVPYKNLTTPTISEMFLDKQSRKTDFQVFDACNVSKEKTFKYEHGLELSNKPSFLHSHLETVRNLISDQDQILEELKTLYHEVHIQES